MLAFYVMGVSDLQDMMPVIISSLKRNKKVNTSSEQYKPSELLLDYLETM